MTNYFRRYMPTAFLMAFTLSGNGYGDDFFTQKPAGQANITGAMDSGFLPVEQAFPVQIQTDTDFVTVSWQIAPDYYLYKRTLKILTTDGQDLTETAELSRAIRSYDGYFGPVEIFYHHAQMRIPSAVLQALSQLKLSYQGCAEAGLCYPVQTLAMPLQLPKSTTSQQNSP